MYAQLPSSFAPLFPVDIRSLKGKVIVVTVLSLLSVLLLSFTVVFAIGFGSVGDCKDAVLYWWIVSLCMEATLIILLTLFSLYIWKTSPITNTG